MKEYGETYLPTCDKTNERKKEEMGLFKRAAIRKTSGMLALMLLVSLLMPVLAFAEIWFDDDVTYKDGSVYGTVYTDSYGLKDVTISVYSSSNNFISTITATYHQTVNGITYYKFRNDGIGNIYNYLKLTVGDNVYQIVQNQTPPPTYGGGGGGGPVGGGSPNGEISVGSDGKVDSANLSSQLKSNNNVTLKVAGETANIPVSALLDANGKTITVVANNGATYVLPINTQWLNDLAKKVGVEAKDLTLQVKIAKVTGNTLTAVQNAVKSLNGKQLADAIDFTVTAQGGGKSVVVEDMGTYTSRTLPLTAKADPNTTTAAVFDAATNTLQFVPAVFSSDNNKNTATIKRQSNSIYTVIEHKKSFGDITGHWAKNDIELLANKLIVNGATDSEFQPERSITRAEFAALIVRALGLNASATGSSFKDVEAGAWYAGVVNAAAKAGLINGYEDGTFRPNNEINREELAALIVRALNYAGVKTEVTPAKVNELLAKFQDSSDIVWAKTEIAAAIDAGIINGMTDVTLAPRDDATRAQSATMLKRLLSKAQFIN